jgi:phosphatidylserine/phosphatidylglycerophosphate/cardiolipin synthase-like enzyme
MPWMMRRLLLGAIGLPVSLLLLCLAYSGSHHADRSHYEDHPSPAAVEAASSPIYFSPSTNLEEVDIALIERARRSIDVAMYTFTDRRIAEVLRHAAERGVHVRVYRDREQYEEELRKGSTVPSILAGSPNIEVRVKRSNELMHEKSMLADSVLRSGSANWSVSAARYQDNEVSVTTDPAMVAAFSREFRAMWDRPDNSQVR